jgi:trk system potassium uptake protein TrkA
VDGTVGSRPVGWRGLSSGGFVADRIGVLGYAVRVRAVAKYINQLALVLAGLMAVPLALAVYDAEPAFALRFGAPLAELKLPDEARVICIDRDEKFLLPQDDARLKAGDEVVLVTHVRNLAALAERWSAK